VNVVVFVSVRHHAALENHAAVQADATDARCMSYLGNFLSLLQFINSLVSVVLSVHDLNRLVALLMLMVFVIIIIC